MVCYACKRTAEQRCERCRRPFCQRHGAGGLCARCSSPASALPSPALFRTTVGASAALLLLAGAYLMWWPEAPSGGSRAYLADNLPKPSRPFAGALEASGPAAPTPPPAATAPAPTSTPPPRTYTIVAGDTPLDIADRFGISVDDLLKANGVTDPGLLQIGQQLVVPPPPGAPAPAAPGASGSPALRTYTIVAGDTPLDIAGRFGISVEELLRANGVADPSLLQIGQVLTIPAPPAAPTPAPSATPTPAAPTSAPASSVPTPTPAPAPSATPTPSPTASPQAARTYTIAAGDTPIDIASRFGISVEDLLRANGVTNPSLLQIGQALTIPPAPSGPTPTPRPPLEHILAAGETALDVAIRYGVDVDALLRFNSIRDPASLQIGQKLLIPN